MQKIQSLAEQSRAEQLNGCVRLGNVYDDEKYTGGNFGGNVWDADGIAPTMKTGASASQQCVVRLEKVKNGYYDAYNNRWCEKDVCGTLATHPQDGHSGTFYLPEVANVKIKIRQATKDGFVDCEIPGVADLNYASSKTRRGRVVMGGQTSPTLTTDNIPSVIEFGNPDFYNFLYEVDGEVYLIRIRKLTPREWWRLMDFSDEDFEKAEQTNSNTRLYAQAGNSIVKNCLVAIFGQMFEGKENVYKTV